METKERFGRYVLHSEDDRTSAGSFFRAVQLGDSGYERHVQLFRSEKLPHDVAELAAEGLKKGASVQHAQIARVFEAGRLDRAAFSASELFEGRSVRALMERSQAERHPFAPDHALLIASKAAAALEAAQARKTIHGFLLPEFIHVSHDGEVSVSGFGLPVRALRQANCVGIQEARFLAPEVEGSATLDIRADLFSLGAQLFEMLTATALPRHQPTRASIEGVRIQTPGGDGTPLPKPLAALLVQALAEEPERRLKDATAFKKAVDTLLFSGDYSPTTFNLAFFMHTLFRDEGDEDAARIKAEKVADYRAYLTPARPSAPASPVLSPSGLQHPAPTQVSSRPQDQTPEALRVESPKPETTRHDSGRTPRPVTLNRPPADEPLFQTVMAEKKPFPVAAVAVIAVVVLGGAGYFMTRNGSPAPTSPAAAPTMNPAEAAALARVKELESRLAALEAEKVAEEQKAAEEAKKIVEAQARARGRAVDPAELQKAQDEARRKAQADQESRLQAERQKIEDERRLAEETRAAEAAKAATPSPTATPAPSLTPTPTATPIPTSTPALSTPTPSAPPPAATPAGPQMLDVADPAVTPPQLVSQNRLEYPPIAKAQRITGMVIISALIDEHGNVAETRLIRGVTSNAGLNEAAMDNVKKRKYKPATLNGKPGRAWVAIQIEFKL